MLKADIARFIALASDDESARVAAAEGLAGLSWLHFDRHPVDSRKLPLDWPAAMAAAWGTTSSNVVRAWIAQVVALVQPVDDKPFEPLLLDFLDVVGPYAYNVVRFVVVRSGGGQPGARERILALHRHRDPKVRSLLSARMDYGLLSTVFDFATDIAIVRTLMLDPDGSVRQKALKIAGANVDRLTVDDFEVLLEAANVERASRRTSTLELIETLSSKLGCSAVDFAPRVPPLRTDGVYYTDVTELDHAGRWVAQRCLRFFPDGRVLAFGTDEAPVDLDNALSQGTRDGAQGVVRRDGDRVEFSVESAAGATDYLGRIDGDRILCASRDRGTNQQVDADYVFTFVDWDNPAPRAPAPRPKTPRGMAAEPLPFERVRPDSLRIADAAKWYLLMVGRLPVFTDGIEGHEQRLRRAWFLKSEMRKAAVKALYDPALGREFLAAMPLPELDEMLQAAAGDAPMADALRLLTTITPAERRAFPGTLQECIGATMVGADCMYVMTEQGWQRQ